MKLFGCILNVFCGRDDDLTWHVDTSYTRGLHKGNVSSSPRGYSALHPKASHTRTTYILPDQLKGTLSYRCKKAPTLSLVGDNYGNLGVRSLEALSVAPIEKADFGLSYMSPEPPSLYLVDIPRDILFDIVTCADVEDIFSVEKTCKTLHELCNSRDLWVFLLRNLDIGQAPRFYPYERIEDLSCTQIRSKVICAVNSSRRWATPGALRPRIVATLEPMPREIPHRASFPSRLKPEVVSGGEYVIIENQGQIELWSIQHSKRVWISPNAAETLFCNSFGSEMQQEGKRITIAAAYTDFINGRSIFRVHLVSVEDSTAELVFERDLQTPVMGLTSVRGDIVMIRHIAVPPIYVCDWKSNRVITLSFSVEEKKVHLATASLTSSHLALLHPNELTLLAIPLSSLWLKASSPTEINHLDVDLGASLSNSSLADIYSDILHINLAESSKGCADKPQAFTIHSFIPPWKSRRLNDTAEEIFVICFGNDGQSAVRSLLSWRLHLLRVSSRPSISEDTWRLSLLAKGCAQTPILPRNAQTITNAGRMLSFYWGLNKFDLFSDAPQPTTILKPAEHSIIDHHASYSVETLDPYSGTLAIRTPGKVTIFELD